MTTKVLICGGFIGESQANAQVRGDIVAGWTALLGEEVVRQCAVTAAAGTIASFRPDLILCAGSYLPETTYFGELRRAANRIGASCIFWATEDPYEIDASYRVAKDFEHIFTNDSSAVPFYRRANVHHLPLAGSETRHFRPVDAKAERPIDVLFCGVAFNGRKRILKAVFDLLHTMNFVVIGPGWGELGRGFSDRRIEKTELIDLYQRSKVVLNIGRSLSFENKRFNLVAATPGPRTFEAALAGTAQLFHEDTGEMRTYFSRDEILPFSSTRDLAALLPALVRDAARRTELARRAQARALSEHTYRHRAAAMLHVVKGGGVV